jgi:serine/threonine protein kinase
MSQDKRLVAVKQLFSSDDVEFKKEVEVLKTLGHKHHPHLIRLLSTYRQKQKYHLMFPWADGNLRQFWDSKPLPQFDKPLVLWSLRQMTGIASALHLIHSFRLSHPLAIQLPGEKMLRKDVEMTVMRQDELFGRHGDIKPENILWLQGHAETEGDLGTLQIADFGSGRFHGRDSRSAGSSNLIFSTPTYEPPESRLNWPISRAYDIWSLGCLYLEFITWLLKGADAIDDFSNVRGQFENGIDNDDFFSISIDDAGRTQATLREGVVSWVDQLHTHEHCSALIHELLDMIMSEVLVINSKDRSPSFSLFQSLKSCLRKAECDASYMMEPVPRAPRRTSIGSISNLSSRSLVLRNGKDLVDRPFPKDLVGRNVHMRRHGSSSTWPPSTRLVANRPNTQS